jgi:hypothetical protein
VVLIGSVSIQGMKMRKTKENIILTSAALITLGASLIGGACRRDYDVTPTEPTPIVTPAPTRTPKPAPTATYAREPTYTPKPTETPATPTPAPTHTPTLVAPTPKPVYANAQEYASVKLPSYLAEHIPTIPLDEDPKRFIDKLNELPEYAKRAMAETGLVKHLINDAGITLSGLAVIEDLDQDDITNLEEKLRDTNVFDPTNTTKTEDNKTTRFLGNLIAYNISQGKSGNIAEIYLGLENVIDVVESNPELIRDFSSLQNHVLANLVSEIPGIAEYPKAMRQGTMQVTSQNLADVYAMEKFVVPAIKSIVKLQDEGKINALNGLGIPDADLEAEGIRQILLPIELREVNIRTGVRTTANLETGIENVTSIEGSKVVGYRTVIEYEDGKKVVREEPVIINYNGRSPQEWLREIGVRDYQDKNSNGYKFVYRELAVETYGPTGPWHNSGEKFVEGMGELMQAGDDLTFFLIRYPTYLRAPASHPIVPGSGNLVPKLTGQTAPYYSVLVGRGFGEAVFVGTAEYPKTTTKGRTFQHDESYVTVPFTNNNWILPHRFGFWLTKEDFVKDYDGKLNKPVLWIRNANSTTEINLAK